MQLSFNATHTVIFLLSLLLYIYYTPYPSISFYSTTFCIAITTLLITLLYKHQDRIINKMRLSVGKKEVYSFTLIVIVILLQSINNVQFKLSADALHNYPYFMSLVSLSVYVVAFGAMFVVEYFILKRVDKQIFQFPLRNYFYISILLAIAHVLLYAAAPKVSGPLQNLLMQAVLVAQFFLSLILLKKKYNWIHWFSVVVIVVGILVIFYPSVFEGPGDARDHSAAGLFWEISILVWCLLWALNNCQYEVILHGKCDNIAWMNVWVSIFCIPTDAILAWIILLTEKKTFYYEMHGGFECLFYGHTHDPTDDTCATAFEKWAWYSGVAMFVSFFNLTLLKNIDAAVLTMTSAVVLPLTNILFASKKLLGPEAVPFDNFTVAAMVIEALGLLAWGVADYFTKDKKNTSNSVVGVSGGEESSISSSGSRSLSQLSASANNSDEERQPMLYNRIDDIDAEPTM